jgi:hypothetical protein
MIAHDPHEIGSLHLGGIGVTIAKRAVGEREAQEMREAEHPLPHRLTRTRR